MGPDNARIATMLDEVAEHLTTQHANPFRLRAYRAAAEVVRHRQDDVAELARREGVKGLSALPSIGAGIGRAILEIVETGRLRLLEQLQGEVCPESLFASVPGVGPVLAARIVDRLHLETLEDLEQAAHDGSLAGVPGFGPRRIEGLRAVLATRLRRSRRAHATGASAKEPVHRPDVADLLAVDREYRRAADADELPRIAPRRFNPEDRAWLPILHTDRAGFHLTALYSNTARAHRLGHTHDWVVIFHQHEGDHAEGQHTIVTEHHGPLRGKRVVRGRERECAGYYGGSQPRSTLPV